jgi:orotidine-5'-phosphate decarboxylase
MKGTPVCVGLDPVFEDLPPSLARPDWPGSGKQMTFASVSKKWGSYLDMPLEVENRFYHLHAIKQFCIGVLDTVAPHVACVKIQSACFERYHSWGVLLFHNIVREAAERGLIVIADAKRGDIGISAAHYATCGLATPPFSHFQEESANVDPVTGMTRDFGDRIAPDAVTINPYFGRDGIIPFIKEAKSRGKGVFTLVRTSNPSGDEIQSCRLEDGRTVAEVVANRVAELGDEPDCIGESGFSLLGAVVGATKPEDGATLRRIMPRQIFLVPGVGAQGGNIEHLGEYFNRDGLGAIITASRAIIYAHTFRTTLDWKGAVEEATVKLKVGINKVLERTK